MVSRLIDEFDYLSIADCLATMRARMCVKRHGESTMDRYFKGVCRKPVSKDGKRPNDPAMYMPPRRLWSRDVRKMRMLADKAIYNKRAIMRHVRWVVKNNKLNEYEWGRRFMEFAGRVRSRVENGEMDFKMPVSFAIAKPNNGIRFVTSFQDLENKVIIRIVAKYLRKAFDKKLSSNCYSFRKNGTITHSTAVEALIKYRNEHKNEILWVAECDIKKFFDVIDHQVAWKAFKRLARNVKIDRVAKKAIKGYLSAYTSTETLLEGCKPEHKEKCSEYIDKIKEILGKADGDVGIPQGGAISALIANWVLDIADRRVERWGDKDLFYARFCDDIVIVHPNRRKCLAARNRYLRTLERLKLPYHKVVEHIPYDATFYEAKTKGPYCWRELRKPNELNVSPWVSFLGNQIRFDGEVRVRQDSINRHVESLKKAQREFLGLLYAAKRNESGITMRKGTKEHPVTHNGVAQAMMRAIVARGVGYLRFGPFSANGNMCWMSAFPNIQGSACKHQLRQLDSVRSKILYPLKKLSGSKHYYGRPASYYGFIDKVARPAIGSGHRLWIEQLLYFGGIV